MLNSDQLAKCLTWGRFGSLSDFSKIGAPTIQGGPLFSRFPKNEPIIQGRPLFKGVLFKEMRYVKVVKLRLG